MMMQEEEEERKEIQDKAVKYTCGLEKLAGELGSSAKCRGILFRINLFT